MAEDPLRKELDALKADIAQLRTDVVSLTKVIKDTASEKVSSTKDEAQKRAQSAWEDAERKFEETIEKGRATVSQLEEKISANPGGSLLTAFGLGFVIAKLMDIGHKH